MSSTRPRRMFAGPVPTLLVCLALTLACSPEPIDGGGSSSGSGFEAGSAVVDAQSTISLEYTLRLEDGSTVETNVDQDPLVVELGQEQMLPAVEEALVGLSVEESASITLSPERGYGTVDPEAVQTVPIDQVPEEARVVGRRLMASDREGNQLPILVKEVNDQSVVLDFNHPLAGETLHFDLKVVGIE